MLEDKTVTCLDMLMELQQSKDATFVATAYTPPPPICLVAGDSPEVPTSAVKSAVVAAARPTVPKRHEIAMISAAEEHRVAEISALELASYKCHNCNAMGHSCTCALSPTTKLTLQAMANSLLQPHGISIERTTCPDSTSATAATGAMGGTMVVVGAGTHVGCRGVGRTCREPAHLRPSVIAIGEKLVLPSKVMDNNMLQGRCVLSAHP